MLETLEDVIGVNDDGFESHPFKGVRGDKKGFFSYTLLTDNKTFKPISEIELRKLIEAGEFNDKGRIRMIPNGATSTGGAGALKIQKYNGKSIR